MNHEKRNLLVFGYGLAVICGIIALRLWMKYGSNMPVWVWGSSAVSALFLTLFSLPALRKIYVIWMKAAGTIGLVMTTVLLTVLFYTAFGIVGVYLRLTGKDLLDQRIDSKRISYWNLRSAKEFDAENYRRQF